MPIKEKVKERERLCGMKNGSRAMRRNDVWVQRERAYIRIEKIVSCFINIKMNGNVRTHLTNSIIIGVLGLKFHSRESWEEIFNFVAGTLRFKVA